MTIVLRNVVVQKMYLSSRARKYYRFSRKRKPIGEIDLCGVSGMRSFGILWKEAINKNGTFSLVGRDNKGRLAKCVGIVNVDHGVISFKDMRCALAKYMKRTRDRIEGNKRNDYVMTGR